MYAIKDCPLCNSTEFTKILNCKDNTVSHETFSLIECKTCKFLITNPRPLNQDLGRYYLSEDYISHSKKTRSIVDLIYKFSRQFTLGWKLSLVKEYSKKKSHLNILDYGCGTGDFLARCKKDGHKIKGVEPSERARQAATEKVGSSISDNIDNIDQFFDSITLWHVLEHVPDLSETINKLSSRLEKNGTMFIAVPNHESYDAKKYQSQWAGYDVPRHLWHFDKNSMQRLLDTNGLSIIRISPMKLDSFYVSILSEKYQNNKASLTGFVRGLISGFISNMKASKNNYSSLIYIARKK